MDLTLKDIPESASCYVCGGDADRIILKYERQYAGRSGETLLASAQVPRFQCGSCDLSYYDPKATVQVLEEMLPVIKEAGDEGAVLDFEDSLEAACQHFAAFN